MSKKPIKPDQKFVRRGNVVEIVTDFPKQELSALDILFNIGALQQEITKTSDEIENMKANIVRLEEALSTNKSRIKNFEKHSDWARTVQESVFRDTVKKVEQECYDKVVKDYKSDDVLTEEQNSKQMFHQYRQFVATHPKMSELVSQEIIRTKLFDENFLDNPWEKSKQ